MQQRIYLDHAATTPLHPQVIHLMHEAMLSNYGNPSSIHSEGRTSRALIEKARKSMANHFNCSIGEIFFTSGATESNNMIIQGAVSGLGVQTIITAATEHHAVLHTIEVLEKEGKIKVIYLPLDNEGNPSIISLEEHLSNQENKKVLVSLMHSNNETGSLLDWESVGAICQKYDALFHSDTVQSVGFYDIDLQNIPVHFIVGSAHKFNGPKGVGFVYIRNENAIPPFQHGGSQERNMRGGTENLLGIVGMALALDLAMSEKSERFAHLEKLKLQLFNGLKDVIPGIQINGPGLENSHPKILNIGFPPNPKATMILFNLDIEGISASGGSACSSGTDTGSHVLRAIYPENQHVSVRFSFSHLNTSSEVDKVIEIISNIYRY
jgi:cysteine desulfurase